MGVDSGAIVFAFLLGAGSFFSPCSVALLPAYLAYYLGLGDNAPPVAPKTALLEGARVGGAAASGILVLYLVGGGLVYAVRTLVHVPSQQLGQLLGATALAIGLGLILLGALMALDRGPTLRLPMRAPRGRTTRSFFLFGLAFAVASLGCTLPLFLAVAANVLVQGPIGGLALVVAFGTGVAGLMFAVSIGLSLAEKGTRRILQVGARWVRPVAALVLVAAGLFIVYYYVFAVPVF